MEKFVPFEKLTKKKQRELNKSRRGGWGEMNPVTRRPENPKAYNRKKARKWSDDSMTVPFCDLYRLNYRQKHFFLLIIPPSLGD